MPARRYAVAPPAIERRFLLSFKPDPYLERLLQSFLCRGEQARQAFAEWVGHGSFDDIPPSHFRQMGELAAVIDTLAPDYPYRSRLMGLKKYVWSNNIHVLRLCLPGLDRLTTAGVPTLLLKGGGVIASQPDALHRRFIRDLDIMVHEPDVPKAAEALFSDGWRASTGRIPGSVRAQPFDKVISKNPHGQNRAEIDLHRSALHFGRYGDFDETMWDRADQGNLMGRAVQFPGATSRALIASMHGLIYDVDSTFVWVVDAVRAMRDPKFSWSDFLNEIRRRKLEQHALRVLDYLQGVFGVGFGEAQRQQLKPSALGFLFDAELDAIAASRDQRGIRGRVEIALAEFARSRSFRRRVEFKTDFGVRMAKVSDQTEPFGVGEEYRFGAVQARRQVDLTIELPLTAKGRRDFDLWRGEVWIARLKIKRPYFGQPSLHGRWRTKVTLTDEIAGNFHISAAN